MLSCVLLAGSFWISGADVAGYKVYMDIEEIAAVKERESRTYIYPKGNKSLWVVLKGDILQYVMKTIDDCGVEQ